MKQLLYDIVTIYMIVLFAYAISSWFPPPRNEAMQMVQRLLHQLVDPVLLPLRRLIPPAGMFDLSFLVLFIILLVLRQALASG